ncbi:MAG: hypothetical protein PHS66_00145, partial [Candidatus Omnitrophica bacterium]|nr:hypothetical protein [Candidatus Omnitrophota bacterium]
MMEITQKDKWLLQNLGLTTLLLITSVFLLDPELFWQYQAFLIIGSILGFIFTWYNRKGVFGNIRYLTDSAVLIVVAWIGYQIFKSTFLYKEVIAILLQGVIILEIIFSFSASIPEKTAYIRVLSLLVFMASSIFSVTYSIPLAIGYLLAWLAILRFQFAGLQPVRVKESQRFYSLATSLICFAIVMAMTWIIFSNIYLGRIKKGGALLDEELQDAGSSGGRKSDLADSFYSLQDDLQSKITGLALELDSYEKRRQLIYLFSELVKDAAKTIEVDKAETGLIDILKREGAGLDGAQKAITFTRTYLDKKGALSLQKNTGSLMDVLRKYPLGIVDKIKITSLANKAAQSNSYQQLQENSRALQAAIQKASVSKYVQNDLSGLARNLAELKAFEFYRRDMKNLEQRTPLADEEAEKKVIEAVSDIRHTESLEDFKQTIKNIRKLKNDPRVSEEKSGKDVLRNLEEASRIKLDLFYMAKSEQVRKDAAQKQEMGPQAEVFNDRMDGADRARNYQEFIQEFSGLSQQNNDNNLGQAEGLAQMLNLKTESFKQAHKDKLDNLMKDNLSSQVKKEMLEAQEAMEEKDSFGDLGKQLEELKNKIKELERTGNIPPQKADELLNAAKGFKDLLDAKIKAEAELTKEDVSKNDSQKIDYIDKLQQAIENSSLNSRQKDVLKALADQLLKAQSLSQLEDVKEALEKEFSSLGLPKLSDKERMLLAAAVNSSAKELEKKIDNLQNVTYEQIRQLQESLKKAQQS